MEHGLTQSMSSPAGQRDNAVIESFFGHLKDEICLIGLKTFEQVIQVIDDYMYYYNNERRQWDKSKMTPVEYRIYLRVNCPLFGGQFIKLQPEKISKRKTLQGQ